MTTFQLCACGTEPGYPHPWWCPFPLYHDGKEATARWDAGRLRLREQNPGREHRCSPNPQECSACHGVEEVKP